MDIDLRSAIFRFVFVNLHRISGYRLSRKVHIVDDSVRNVRCRGIAMVKITSTILRKTGGKWENVFLQIVPELFLEKQFPKLFQNFPSFSKNNPGKIDISRVGLYIRLVEEKKTFCISSLMGWKNILFKILSDVSALTEFRKDYNHRGGF